MEALEFLKEYRRMCNTSDHHCDGCPLKEEECLSSGMRLKSDSQFLTITCAVEQWSKEHPIITNARKFEEVFGYKPKFGNGDYYCPPKTVKDCCDSECKTCNKWWDEPYKEPDIEHVSYDAEQTGREK